MLPLKESENLLRDLQAARVVSVVSDRSLVKFILNGYERPVYEGQHSYPVEIRLFDEDGSELTAILYADSNDRLLELEVIRWDGGELISPKVESIEYYK